MRKIIYLDRLLAFFIDIILIYLIIYTTSNLTFYLENIFNFSIGNNIFYLIFKYIDIPFLYFLYFHYKKSQTPGMKLLGLKLLTFEGEPLGFKKVTLRIVYFFLLYFTPFIILFLINLSINNLELNRILDKVAYWFVFVNPLFMGGVLFSFFNSQKATIYDFAVRGSYQYDLNSESEIKLDSEITYVDPNINKKQLYLSQILDLFIQLIIILGGNFILNNFFDPSLGVSNNSFVNFFVNFLILSTFIPLLYTFISLQNSNKSIGMVITKLNPETINSKKLILRNLIFTYLMILLIEMLLGFYSY